MSRILVAVLFLVSALGPGVVPAIAATPPAMACCEESPGAPACADDPEVQTDEPAPGCCADDCTDCDLTCCHRVMGPAVSFASALAPQPCTQTASGPAATPCLPEARRIEHPPRS